MDDRSNGDPGPEDSPSIALRSRTGRWILVVTVMASGIAFLDATAVTVALPHIADELGAGVSGLQWVVDGYLLTLAALILLGGSLGDHLGRRRVFSAGVAVFAVGSTLCAVAPTAWALVVARLVQGVGGALLTPNSLAILEASIRTDDRARAVGAWTGLTGVAAAFGPLLGGWVTDAVSWRLVFLLNLPFAAFVVLVARREVPESSDPGATGGVDLPGSALLVSALGAIAWGLIESGGAGFGALSASAVGAGIVLLVGFVVVERRRSAPLVPLEVFGEEQFRAANAVTVVVYAALGAVFFLLVIHLQRVLGYSALEAGAASSPITVLMLVLSPGSGALAQRIGPRTQMTVGPLVLAVAVYLIGRIGPGDGYVTAVLPPVTLFGLGLAATVAPLTATALASLPDRHAGVASGVNTAVARAAQLAAVAAIPVVAGLQEASLGDPAALADGFRTAMEVTAVLAAAGGVLAFTTVRNPLAGKG